MHILWFVYLWGSNMSDAVVNATLETTAEVVTLTTELLRYLLGRVLATEHLSEVEKAHIAGIQLSVLMMTLNNHLENIGNANFDIVSSQVQRILENERKGLNQSARLSKLAALLVPLPMFTPTSAS